MSKAPVKTAIYACVFFVLLMTALMVRASVQQENTASPSSGQPSPTHQSSTSQGPPSTVDETQRSSHAIDPELLKAINGFEAAVWSIRYDETVEARTTRLAPFVSPVFVDVHAPDSGELGANQAQLATITNKTVVEASVASAADINVAVLAPAVATATVTVSRHTTDATGYDASDTVTDTVYLRQENGKWLVRLHTPGQVNDG